MAFNPAWIMYLLKILFFLLLLESFQPAIIAKSNFPSKLKFLDDWRDAQTCGVAIINYVAIVSLILLVFQGMHCR